MGRGEVDAALDRLVSQFASPYDFLRELVQNSMDAGSDRVEVSIERHPDAEAEGQGADAVFELSIMDTGVGMDESIIDGALTRLFASTKRDDRTMAGGFGVGFVSVFAWEPEVVLVQTGKGGEAWELTFYADRRFEKTRLDQPVEGTTITLLRRADSGAYAAVADAVRDSLWRWCRYTQVEVSFEDFSEGDGPELIQDAPEPEDFVVSRSDKVGDGYVRVAFAIPPNAVLMRRGLILEEGEPSSLIKGLGARGHSAQHLAVWVDSPELETTLARDSIVETSGREKIEARVLEQVDLLRAELLSQLEQLCTQAQSWTVASAARYATLHAHLGLEWSQAGPDAGSRKLLRAREDAEGRLWGEQRAWSPSALKAHCAGGPLVVSLIDVDTTTEPEPDTEPESDMEADESEGLPASPVSWGPSWPVLVADRLYRSWMAPWGEALGLKIVRLEQVLGQLKLDGPSREPLKGELEYMTKLQQSLGKLLGQGLEGGVQLSVVAGLDADDADPPFCGWALDGLADGAAVMTCRHGLPRRALSNLVLDRRHLLVQAALRIQSRAPLAARANLLSAILGIIASTVSPKQLQDHLWEVREGG